MDELGWAHGYHGDTDVILLPGGPVFGLWCGHWYHGENGIVFATSRYSVACAQEMCTKLLVGHDGFEIKRIGMGGYPAEITPLDRGEVIELSSSQNLYSTVLPVSEQRDQ